MRTLILATTAVIALSTPAISQADGKELHEENCTRCHGSEVYTREDRKVTSREGLTKQVRRCTTMLGVQWFDDDIDAVAEYLNSTYYKF